MKAQELTYKIPAENWEEALPLGNGRLGAMVFGGTSAERIALNEECLWTGFPRNVERPGAHRVQEQVRELLEQGETARAEALVKQDMLGKYWTATFQPLGDLLIHSPDPSGSAPSGGPVEIGRASCRERV